MSWLLRNAELVGTLAGFVCVWLTVRQNVWNWPLGIINNALFLIVLAQDRLYANAGLQAVFIILGFYGWWMWLYGGVERSPLPVSRLRPVQRGLCAVIWVLGTLGLAALLKEMARRTGIAPPDYVVWDSSITVASLIAQWLLTWKKIDNWFIWIVLVNLSQIFLFGLKGRNWMAGLQVAYIILSVQGYQAWRADLPKDPWLTNDPAQASA